MKSDIQIPRVKNVTIAIAQEKSMPDGAEWRAFLINDNDVDIENTLVASKGYGEKNGEAQKTSVLRHYLETVPANSTALIEPIDPGVFHLNNEYWVSYYIDGQIYDKRFIFVPETICKENLVFVKALNTEGILHS